MMIRLVHMILLCRIETPFVSRINPVAFGAPDYTGPRQHYNWRNPFGVVPLHGWKLKMIMGRPKLSADTRSVSSSTIHLDLISGLKL